MLSLSWSRAYEIKQISTAGMLISGIVIIRTVKTTSVLGNLLVQTRLWPSLPSHQLLGTSAEI